MEETLLGYKVRSYSMRGDANYKLKKYGDAIKDLNRVIGLKSKNERDYQKRGDKSK